MPNTPQDLGPVADRVAHNVRALRLEKGWTLAQLSDQLANVGRHLGAEAISGLERTAGARRRRCDVDDLCALAVVLGVTPTRLLLTGTARSGEPCPVVPAATSTPSESAAWAWASGEQPLTVGGRSDAEVAAFQQVNRPHAATAAVSDDEHVQHWREIAQLWESCESAMESGLGDDQVRGLVNRALNPINRAVRQADREGTNRRKDSSDGER